MVGRFRTCTPLISVLAIPCDLWAMHGISNKGALVVPGSLTVQYPYYNVRIRNPYAYTSEKYFILRMQPTWVLPRTPFFIF